MHEEPIFKVPYHFPGITVLVPKQLEIEAIDLRPINTDEIPVEDKNGIKVIRYIVNIVLYNRQGEPVETFDPPIELRVGYNFLDVMKSDCDIQKLKLAYWDGEKYVIISNREHEYQILSPSIGQVAEAKIWSWVGDPPLVWVT